MRGTCSLSVLQALLLQISGTNFSALLAVCSGVMASRLVWARYQPMTADQVQQLFPKEFVGRRRLALK